MTVDATPVVDPSISFDASPEASPGAYPVGLTCSIWIMDFDFEPRRVDIRVGTTVTWINFDNRTHGVRIVGLPDASGRIRPYGEHSYTFTVPGTYLVTNSEYPGRPNGTIYVY